MLTNRCSCHFVVLIILLLAVRPTSAQSLSQELLNEDPAKITKDALSQGDVVRGAILFHQGNIACAKCHRQSDEDGSIGPDLSRLGDEVTNESIVESILDPSKVIAEKFQTTTIVDIDGLVFSGVVARQDEDAIVLRDAKDVLQLITIERDRIEEAVQGTTSIMPASLADELTGRQQFLDLLRYVIDMKERGPVAGNEVADRVAQRELSPEIAGLALLREHNCAACHQPRDLDADLLRSSAPDLLWSAKRLNPAYLADFIADPHEMKPGTAMPQLMPQLDEAARSEAAAAIVSYLVSLGGNDFNESVLPADDPAAIQSGFALFHSVGCVACHSPRSDAAVEQPLPDSVPLGDLRGKYSLSALVDFLEHPHLVRPEGRMPDMQLTHHEAVDVAGYLLQANENTKTHQPGAEGPDAELIQMGKSLFASMNCAACHTGLEGVEPPEPASMAMANWDAEDGCLSGAESEEWPLFDLTDAERMQIQAAIAKPEQGLTDNQRIDFDLTYFNCTACHHRDDLGGVPEDRNFHFQTTNLNLGDQGRIPPTLSGVGAKLNENWMRDVLVHGRSTRPYMKTRMPKFGEQNIGHLIDLFQATDHLEETEFAELHDLKELRAQGLKLAGNQGLNCVACHTYQYKTSDTMPAVDLTEMAARLKKDWFYQYMLAPQAFSPHTVMPSFWPNGKSIRTDIEGSPQDQVEALWQYLKDGRQARPPRGVIREPLEIVVDGQARLLRRSYPEIGKRGIGVGYAGGINLAYDAEQARLALLWKGRFIDPSGVWYGQGHGNVRPMGSTIVLPKGPELDSLESPWTVDEGRPPQHQFKGYVFDDEERPTFLYSFGNVDVEDYFTQSRDNPTEPLSLLRQVKLTSSGTAQPLRFRLAAGESAAIHADGKEVVDGRLRIRIASEHTAELVDHSTGVQVIVPISLDQGDTTELILEYQWDAEP
ncbi:c-type cytochrome [Allorhodopirellula solitaria]|uniref:Cytochrome c n=1 Tax=Allorhodopirellula solitaria TaxID=2527987 RepID=A0A5C5YIR4_9BACT|nr:c-type cytochrome [Allorhodopirellula solitaria]TWT74762.1 Cytochrome c [Allorhodopirellula solitaria]